jgi:hypothetical protein
MLKITAYASSRPTQQNKNGKTLKDGWGFDRQTIYLKKDAYHSFQDQSYRDIARHQLEFCDVLEKLMQADPAWIKQNALDGKIEKIYNDPTAYTLTEIIEDIREHYKRSHDPALSMLLRQRYLIRKLAKLIGDNSLVPGWDIDIKFTNPSTPVLKKFFDKGVFDKEESTTFNNLFGV